MEFHPPVIGSMQKLIANFDGIGRHWQLNIGSGEKIKSIFLSINSFSNFRDSKKCFGMCKVDISTYPSARLKIMVSTKKEDTRASNFPFCDLGQN